MTCDTAFVTTPNWDVSNCVARPLILDTVSRMSLIPFRGVCRCTYILLLIYTCLSADASSGKACGCLQEDFSGPTRLRAQEIDYRTPIYFRQSPSPTVSRGYIVPIGCPSPSLIRLVIMEEASKIEESEYNVSTGNKTQIEHIYQQTVFVHKIYAPCSPDTWRTRISKDPPNLRIPVSVPSSSPNLSQTRHIS